jgi:outer membrane protein assembly factor BamA
MSGNVSPILLRGDGTPRIAFVSFYKGRNGLHTVTLEKPVATAASADFGEPGPVIDFTPQIAHAFVPENVARKGKWERMMLAGRPPIGVGVTSGGDVFGNTQISFTDILGDQQITLFAQSIAQYRTISLLYLNIENRLQYAFQAFSSDLFYYGQNSFFSDFGPILDRDQAVAVQTQRGATGFGIYPFNRYTRAELSGGYAHINERYNDPVIQQLAEQYQDFVYGAPVFRSGHMLPLSASLVRETTVFREYGPVSGNTFKLTFSGSPAISDQWLSRRSVEADLRTYRRIAANGVLALRFKGFKSWGLHPDFMYFGGNSELRGYDYLSFLGHKAFFANAELRFPLIEAMLTPAGVLGGLRGVFFFNIGGGGFNNAPFTALSNSDGEYSPIIGYEQDLLGFFRPITIGPFPVSGFRLVDARASYGIGLQSLLLGFPMHIDWSWRTLFNRNWEDMRFLFEAIQTGSPSGSDWFRKVKFAFWIGYDF